MKATKFTNQQILQTINRVTSQYQLKPQFIMSTSGELFVLSLKGKKQTYLLKVRKKIGKSAQIKFKNEIKLLTSLKKKNIPGLVLPNFIAADVKHQPEYLLYSFIDGWPLNTFYIYIGRRLTKKFLQSNFLNIIKTWQKLKPRNTKLKTKNFSQNLLTFLQYKKTLKNLDSKQLYKNIATTLRTHRGLFKTKPVITHGDLNPKNIIISHNKVSIIDWSDVHLNNPLYDLSMLYMYAWNRPEIMEEIRKYIRHNFPELPNPDQLHLLNRLILTPKMIQIMEDSIVGIKEDRKKKIILAHTEKILNIAAKQAITKYLYDAKKIVEHFTMWRQQQPTIKVIKKLYNFNSAKTFIAKHKKQLQLTTGWELKNQKNHRLILRENDQKLISECTLRNGKKEKVIMLKIRMERGDDLAKQSYQILQNIWTSPNGPKLVSKPLHYFSKQRAYFYEKTLGESLGSLVEQKKIKKVYELNTQMRKAAKVLTTLHALPTEHFKHTKFINNYDIDQQIYWFIHSLKRNKKTNTPNNLKLARQLKNIYQNLQKDTDIQKRLIHGDYQLQNLIFYHGKLKLIDFDNAEINDPLIDVGNLLNQINYKGLLEQHASTLRRTFLNSYLLLTKTKLDASIKRRLNFYIIMGKVKNTNFNMLEGEIDLVLYDIQKIKYLLKYTHLDPILNLKEVQSHLNML